MARSYISSHYQGCRAVGQQFTDHNPTTGEVTLSKTELASRVFTFLMAGGRGERLHPLTADRAKPLVTFGGSYRLIDFTLSNCFNSSLPRVRVLTQYHSAWVQQYVSDVAAHAPVRMASSDRLSCLSPKPGRVYRGTADAVFQNLQCLDETEPDFVLILSSDHVYSMDYLDLVRFHANSGSQLTVAATECPSSAASQFGVVETDSGGNVIGFEEKPSSPKALPDKPKRSLVNMGVYVFTTSALRHWLSADGRSRSSHDFGKDVIPAVVNQGKAAVYNFAEHGGRLGTYWRDVGTVDGYYKAHTELLLNLGPDLCDSAAWPMYSPNSRPVFVSDSASIRDSITAKDASMHAGAEVIHSVLSPRVTVGRRAQVEDSILMPGVHVGDGARIRRAIIDENVTIPNGMRIGFDPGEDCRAGFVTEAGIVVISMHRLEQRVQEVSRNAERTILAVPTHRQSAPSAEKANRRRL